MILKKIFKSYSNISYGMFLLITCALLNNQSRDTRGIHFCCRNVFERVQKHVFDLLPKCSFGAEYYFEYTPKMLIQTIQNAPKLKFETWPLISERKMHQNCNIREKTSNQVSIWILKLFWSTGFEKLVCWSCYNCPLIFKKRVRLIISSTLVSAI